MDALHRMSSTIKHLSYEPLKISCKVTNEFFGYIVD